MHTNKINNKKYIGITCQEPQQRWRNGKGYKNGYFSNAINKYGWDNFEHTILAEGLPEEFAKQMEMVYIEEYKTMDSKYGYNLCEGGNLTTGYHHTEEARKKMSLAKKGIFEGENNPMYGRKGNLAPAFGIKRDEKWKSTRYRSVKAYDMEGNYIDTYKSIIEASEKTGCDRRNISRVCRGGRPSCHGYRFEYSEAI